MTVLNDDRLELMRRRLVGAEPPPGAPVTDGDTAPSGALGVAERRMWRIHEMDPESISHNIGIVLTFETGYDIHGVVASVETLLAGTPVLASLITVDDDGTPRRVPHRIDGRWVVDGSIREWNPTATPRDDTHRGTVTRAELAHTATELTHRPFDLTTGPPVRAQVIALHDGAVALILVVHHLAVDGTSWPVLLDPLISQSRAMDTVEVTGATTTVDARRVEEALQYALRGWAADDVRHPLTSALPDGTAEQSWIAPLDDGKVVRERRALDPDVVTALAETAREIGATQNAVLIGICALSVHSLCGVDDFVTLVPTDNRRPGQDPRVIGYSGNIVPMRFAIDPTASVRENLRHLASTIYTSMEYADVDFGSILTALRGHGGRFPVADVLISVRNTPTRGLTPPSGHAVAYESVSTDIGSYPLSYAFDIDENDGVHLELDRRVDSADDDVARRAIDIALTLSAEITGELDSVLSDVVDTVRAVCFADALPALPSRFASPGTGWARVGDGLRRMAESVNAAAHHRAPLPRGLPGEVLATVAESLGPSVIPANGIGDSAALAHLGELVARHGLDLTHPRAAAHLQPPPLTVAVIADALASATNASLDTYDSGPATLAIETWMISALADLAGFGADAGGVFGPGGSYSNLLALLIARDHAAARLGADTRADGTGALHRPVVFCSRVAHFSIHRACAALGLGESAVVPVDVDEDHRMLPAALTAALAAATDRTTIAIVATAGTTDFGTIDPLVEIAEIARRHDVWMHVDAAYGFGSLLSDRLRGLVDGISNADSITLDLHKIGWQPAAASVLLLAREERFAAVDRSVAYLNPTDDIEAGYGGLLGQTLQTTRRPDVLKVAATVLAYGRRGLGTMLDACHDLARYAEQRIATEPHLELIAPVTLTTVVFRYRCADLDAVNAELRRRLIRSGSALIGRTRVRLPGGGEPQVCLKLTLLNPEAHESDVDALFDDIVRMALEVESEGAQGAPTEMVRTAE